jgi:hypothetical protein
MIIKVKKNDNHIFKKRKYQTIKYNDEMFGRKTWKMYLLILKKYIIDLLVICFIKVNVSILFLSLLYVICTSLLSRIVCCLLIAFHFLSMAGWQLDLAMTSWIRDVFRVAVNCFEFPVVIPCFQEWELLSNFEILYFDSHLFCNFM